MHARALTVFAFVAGAFAACSGGPRPIEAGVDACDFCRMTISDARFGGEVRLTTGRVYTFDSMECLTGFYVTLKPGSLRNVWVIDFRTATLIPAERALFVRGEKWRSPMGRVAAFDTGASVRELKIGNDEELLTWPELLQLRRSATSDARRDAVESLTARNEGVESAPEHTVSIAAAVAAARAGDTIVVAPGEYREPTIRVDRPLTLVGNGRVVLDGAGERGLFVIAADDVTIRGFLLRHTGRSQVDDRAAIVADGVRGCLIADNRIDDAFFAIYLARTSGCVIRGNTIRGSGASQGVNGNGVHVWQSDRVQVLGNRVTGQRDGIYFEFVREGVVRENTSEGNDRYGLHFMFSDDCRYERNTFVANGAGVAVMYTHRVHMLDNLFERNLGSAAYGLLLKEISDSEVRRNRFRANSTGLYLEGSNRNAVEANEFVENGWALRILADAQDNRVTGNTFERNTFDVSTNSRGNFSTFSGNYWDRYRGYDLDRDGVGDVPFRPVRLFALVVEQSPSTLILLRSVLVDALDVVERVMPIVTPEALVDDHPMMRSRRSGKNVPTTVATPTRRMREPGS